MTKLHRIFSSYWTSIAIMLSMAFAPTANAQILIGQTASFTGTPAAAVKEITDGANLYLNWINRNGGVSGKQIKLISMDDKFDPKTTADNAQILLETQGVLALILTRGTPHSEAVLPLLEKHRAVLIAPSTGANIFHQPVNRWVFNVRSSYQSELIRIVSHIKTLGSGRIAVIYRDDSFGDDALIGLNAGFKKYQLVPILISKFDKNKPDLAPSIAEAVKREADHLIFIGGISEVNQGVRALRLAGSRARVYTPSNNAATGFIKALGEHAAGVVVSQVFPYERSIKHGITREMLALGKDQGVTDISPAMMEGFAASKVLVEGLRRASPNPTREKLRAALETMKNFDIGGLTVSYSPSDHTGIEFVDLSIIASDGKFRR